MAKSKKRNIDPKLLPDDWRAQAAKHFDVSESTIEKVAYGLRGNDEVFLYLLDLAEKHKADQDEQERIINERLQALTS